MSPDFWLGLGFAPLASVIIVAGVMTKGPKTWSARARRIERLEAELKEAKADLIETKKNRDAWVQGSHQAFDILGDVEKQITLARRCITAQSARPETGEASA